MLDHWEEMVRESQNVWKKTLQEKKKNKQTDRQKTRHSTMLRNEKMKAFHKGLLYCVGTGIKQVQNQEEKRTQRRTMCESDSCHLLHFGHSFWEVGLEFRY